MSRYTGPTTKINRRFGMALFPENKAMQKKPYIPGQHGPHLRRRVTDYSMGLNEKQKLRFMFGLSEKQFRLTFARAKRMGGVVGENFLTLLETRLDSVVYLLGFANTRRAARQLVGPVRPAAQVVAHRTCRLATQRVGLVAERAVEPHGPLGGRHVAPERMETGTHRAKTAKGNRRAPIAFR